MTQIQFPILSFPCTACKGARGEMRNKFCRFEADGLDPEGKIVKAGEYGYEAEQSWHECSSCKGRGEFPGLTLDECKKLALDCLASKGPRRGRIKTGPGKMKGRAYFVWCLARFHAGHDMTMPMAAEDEIQGDGARDILDLIARTVAQKTTGKTSIGVACWQHALTGQGPDYLDMLLTSRG